MANLLPNLDARADKGFAHRITVMTYELGRIAQGLVYADHAMTRIKPDTNSSEGYREEARIGLEDLITQCRLLAEEQRWKYNELQDRGEARFLERMKQLEEEKI